MSKLPKIKVVIIGGGYAGLRTIEKLSKNSHLEILLLDKNPYHYMQTDVYDLIANEKDFAAVSVDLYTLCMGFENVTFLKQEVKDIDFEKQKVITNTQRIAYDYVVIAVGARTKFAHNVEGLREYAHGIKALHRAMYFKQKFEMSLFKKVDEDGTVCTPLSIVVAGAGLSGVEIAAQMASFAKNFYKKNHFICRKLNIVLVNSAEHILHGMEKPLVLKSTRRLEKLGVVIKNNVKVTALSKAYVTLSSSEQIPMDFMIFAGGIEPNGLIYKLDLPKNERGFLQTNEYLQSTLHKNAFAVGDAITIYDTKGKILAPTADISEQMGELCAKNILAMIEEKELHKHTIRSRGVLIALGKGYASARVFGVYFHGYFAYVAKKIIEKLYFKNLDAISKSGCRKIFNND